MMDSPFVRAMKAEERELSRARGLIGKLQAEKESLRAERAALIEALERIARNLENVYHADGTYYDHFKAAESALHIARAALSQTKGEREDG